MKSNIKSIAERFTKSMIEIKDNCIGCGKCVIACSPKVFVVKDGKSIVMNEIRCIKCGHCVAICPVDAINHDKINFEDCKLINDNMHIEYEHLLDFVRKRRSIRQYLDKPIEKEKLKKLLDIARYSPSAKNSQDFEFVVIQDKEKINKLRTLAVEHYSNKLKILDNPIVKFFILFAGKKVYNKVNRLILGLKKLVNSFKSDRDNLFHNAPVLVAVHSRKRGLQSNDNCCFASYNLMLGAESVNLGTCVIGYFLYVAKKSKKVRDEMGIPKSHMIHNIIVLGEPNIKYRRLTSRNKPKVKWIL